MCCIINYLISKAIHIHISHSIHTHKQRIRSVYMMLFDVIQFKDYLKTTVYDIIVKRKN